MSTVEGSQCNGATNSRSAAVLARALCDAEPTDVVISPGSRSTPLALALIAEPRARVHVVLDERAAGFIALGLARSRGRAAVALCTSGSAGAHYAPAVMEASHARVPLVLVTADRPPEKQHCGAPQTTAQSNLFASFLRLAVQLPTPSQRLDPRWLRNMVARARLAAEGSPPGPVHLNAPFAEPLWAATKQLDALPRTWTLRGASRLDEHDLRLLASRLERAQRGLLVCGPLASTVTEPQPLAEAVSRLSTSLGWPLLADPLSGLRFGGHDRSHIISAYDLVLRVEEAAALSPDLVLAVGMPPTSKALARFLARHARDKVILLDADGHWLDPESAAAALVHADPTHTCRCLAERIEAPASASAWLRSWRQADAVARNAVEGPAGSGDWEGRLARTLCAALPDGAQLHLASSMPVRDVDAFAPSVGRAIRVQGNRGLNGIDGTLATAAGEALGYPGGPTVLLVGDLALRHDLGGLAAAAALGARLTVVVIDNAGGGIFSALPIARQLERQPEIFEKLFTTPQPQPLGPLCTAAGARYRHLSSLDGFGDALAGELEAAGVSVIGVAVDRLGGAEAREQASQKATSSLEEHFRARGAPMKGTST